jgi:hypothetical protein
MKTAVEQLISEIKRRVSIIQSEPQTMARELMIENLDMDLERFKEMEKEQRVDDYANGMHKGQEIYFNHQIRLDVNSINYSTTIAEEYYNETYGGN